MKTLTTILALLAIAAVVTGCADIEPRVSMPETTAVALRVPAREPATNGAIFQVKSAYRSLAEDNTPMFPGDILTIALEEKSSASRTSNSAASKTGTVEAKIPVLRGFTGAGLTGAAASANSNNTYEGSGTASNSNAFEGRITVTVIERLPNGNLMVAGEKQIGINHNTENIRFSGVVNPLQIQPGNVISSTQVADARLEYTGKGYIDEAQRMGWLSRFFLSALPI